LASDIEVIDGFPEKVNSYMLRLHRWTRGDWQIFSWIFKNALNPLSKYKIIDNWRRSLLDIFLLMLFFTKYYSISIITLFFPFLIDVFERLIHDKGGIKPKNYLPIMNGVLGSFFRCSFHLMILPYQAVLLLRAIIVTLYRVFISKSNLLEWVTASDAEKMLGNQLKNYVKEMKISFVFSILLILCNFISYQYEWYICIIVALIWSVAPIVSFFISKPGKRIVENLTLRECEELKEIGRKTWNYFDENMKEENNFLPPDNYQLGRKNKLVNTTSSTNIGLGLMAVIAACDMNYISVERGLEKIKQLINTILKLEKWNGHLYNWYQIKTLQPLNPKFVSTVDSGNFVGYLYVTKEFLKEKGEKESAAIVSKLIDETDFSKLYDEDKNLFSIGYDMRDNKLIDSYYDLLASEARLASFIAIAKRDVPYKHWFSMSRTLTCVDRHKGLVSWSGTMFEYFMPFIVMKTYPYTLLDETYEFCIYSQIKYAKKLNIPWGISESAFNLQDLNDNYQYKAFGIPWLGLKRGLKEEVVVSPYSSFLALEKKPKEVFQNVVKLKQLGAFDQYGFYDAIDFTPNRVGTEGHSIVKTFMAHHEALILLSINNYMNQHIFQKRFSSNEEVKSAELLLQERVPTNVVFTKKKKEKIKVLKYKNYEEHVEDVIHQPSGNVNIQSNNSYTLLINDFGECYAMYDHFLLTKYNDTIKQGNCVYIKNLENGQVITNTPFPIMKEKDEFEIDFSPSSSKFYRKNEWMEVKTRIAISPEENVEVRKVTIKNITDKELNIDVMSYLEPVLANRNDDIVHPAYHHLFFRSIPYENAIILEKRMHQDVLYYLNFIVSDGEGGQEFELDKTKIIGRLNTIQNPLIANNDVAYSNENGISTNTIISFKKNLKIKAGEEKTIHYFFGVGKSYNEMIEIYQKYQMLEAANRLFELAYSKSLVENRFLGYKGKDILMYHKLFSLIENNHTREAFQNKINKNHLKQSDLWKFGVSGDFPIILVKIRRVNDIYVIKDLISAIEYYYKKNLFVDLIVLNEEESKYEQYVQDKIYEAISSKGLQYLLHQNGGIFIIKKQDINEEEECLLLSCSNMIINARDGFLKEQIYERE